MNAAVPNSTARNFLLNDHGGVTYTPGRQPGKAEARSDLLADVRVLADATHDLCAAHRNFWPERYPVPEDVHCALLAADYGLARVRGGTLKRLAEQDTALYLPQPRYRVDLADLIHIADAAAELDAMRAFLIDQAGEQQRIASIVKRLHDLVEKAAGQHAHAIYGKPQHAPAREHEAAQSAS
ncbi:hypothetical protein [Thiobacillus denitrificans]|uniref:Uncharacterized protein n=1 Tax=Thiobacillus denitrificans TaxID=36861 RepID=A0A106BHI4_THIDE|nr:hypothetical protein [Thiobacillus denitrificans]KVW92636.1 hypothetical protein ABW22_15780 [Thiobacillus denitrificans]